MNEDLKSYPTSKLEQYKTELEKEVEEESEIGYKGIEFKHVFYDKDGELVIIDNFKKTKLKDLRDKKSGEKIFKDESQTDKNYMGMDSLKFYKSYFNEYKRHQKRLADIKTELMHRKYGIAPYEQGATVKINSKCQDNVSTWLKENKYTRKILLRKNLSELSKLIKNELNLYTEGTIRQSLIKIRDKL